MVQTSTALRITVKKSERLQEPLGFRDNMTGGNP